MKHRCLICAAVAAALLLILSAACAAEVTEYAAAGTDVRISLPAGWYFTDGLIIDGDPVCKVMGLSGDAVRKQMAEHGWLFAAASKEMGCVMYLTDEESPIADFAECSEATLVSMAHFFSSKLTASGYETGAADVVNFGRPFVRIRFADRQGTRYVDYITARGGRLYTVTATAADIGEDGERKLEEIMGTFRFAEADEENWETYAVDSPDVSVRIPKGYYVFWRSMPENAPSLLAAGQTLRSWTETFNDNPTLMLMAISDEQVISLFIEDAEGYPDLGTLETDEIRRYIRAVDAPQSAAGGSRILQYRLIRTDRYTFIHSVLANDSGTYPYSMTAYTFRDGKMILLRYESAGAFGDGETAAFAEVVRSVTLGGLAQNTAEATEWFDPDGIASYTARTGNLTLKIPAEYMYYADDMPANDLCLAAMGLPYPEMSALLESSGSVLCAFTYSLDGYFTVGEAGDTDEGDYTAENVMDVIEMMSTMSAYIGLMDDTEVTEEKLIAPAGDGRYYWVLISARHPKQDTTQVLLFTVAGGRQYTIIYENQTVTDADAAAMSGIAQSVRFE